MDDPATMPFDRQRMNYGSFATILNRKGSMLIGPARQLRTGHKRAHLKGAGDHGRRRPRKSEYGGSVHRGGRSWIFRSSVALKSSARTLPAPIETLDTKGADFRSLGDPIDTTSPQGRFTLQTVTAERA